MGLRALRPVEAHGRRYEAGERLPDLRDSTAAQLIESGAAERADSADDRSARIQSALDGLADAPDDARTQSGAPSLAWLREETGLPDLTGAERDREWRLHGSARDAG